MSIETSSSDPTVSEPLDEFAAFYGVKSWTAHAAHMAGEADSFVPTMYVPSGPEAPRTARELMAGAILHLPYEFPKAS